MKKSGPTHISENLQSLFRHELKAPNLGAELKIWEFWEAAVGQEIARQTNPKMFKNGILFVDAKHSAWVVELQFRSHQILDKLNKSIGYELVKEIQFRLGHS